MKLENIEKCKNQVDTIIIGVNTNYVNEIQNSSFLQHTI